MAHKVFILKSAQAEYRQIVDHLTDSDNEEASQGFAKDFSKMTESLAKNPTSHKLSRISLLADEGYRTLTIDRYVVLYKVTDGAVYIASLFPKTHSLV